MNLPKEIHMNL